jgi:hypothetical protein
VGAPVWEVGGHTHYLVMQRNIFWNAPLFSEIYDLKVR